MPCPYSNQIQDYLEENLSCEEIERMEEHIEICLECQQQLEELLDSPLKLKEQSMEIDDEVLVEKIKVHRRGIRRIKAYGILGFLLGLFSLKYTSDSFIVTKAIMALPYKLAEFMLGIFFSRNKLNPWQQMVWEDNWQRGMGYFPHNPILGLVVELITPALVGMFLAMMMGYLTSDKRVFQRKKILRFISSATIIFILWFGMIYGIYSNTLNKIKFLEEIKAITIYEKQENSSSWIVRIDENNLYEERYNLILSGISEATELENYSSINDKEGLRLNIAFKGGGLTMAHVDTDTGKMLMQNHRHYQLSEDTLSRLVDLTRRGNNED